MVCAMVRAKGRVQVGKRVREMGRSPLQLSTCQTKMGRMPLLLVLVVGGLNPVAGPAVFDALCTGECACRMADQQQQRRWHHVHCALLHPSLHYHCSPV